MKFIVKMLFVVLVGIGIASLADVQDPAFTKVAEIERNTIQLKVQVQQNASDINELRQLVIKYHDGLPN